MPGMRFRVTILGSSSSGNCALLETSQARVLVDVGFSGRRLESMLGTQGLSLEDIDAVFLTHEHGDHVAGLPALSRLTGMQFFANRDTAQAVQARLKRPVDWRLFESGSSFAYRDLRISTFSVPHDAYDPVGFVFSCQSGAGVDSPPCSIAWLTDLGHIPAHVQERVRPVDALILEANHDLRLLEEDDRRPWSLKQRIKSRHGHLSNDAAEAFLRSGLEVNWKRVFLGHLSRDCNRVDLVVERFRDRLSQTPLPCPVSILDPCGPAVVCDLLALQPPQAAADQRASARSLA